MSLGANLTGPQPQQQTAIPDPATLPADGVINILGGSNGTRRRPPPTRASRNEAEDVRRWRRRITDFLAWRKREYGDITARDGEFKEVFMNRFNAVVDASGIDVNVNWVYLFWLIVKGSLSKSNPKPYAEPARARDHGLSKQAAAALMYTQREINMKQEIDKALDDALLSGYGGFLITKYASRFGYIPIEGEESEHGRQLSKDGTREIEHDAYIRSGMPVVKRWPGNKIGWDWTATEIDEAAWVFLESDRKLEDFRQDPRYRPAVAKQVADKMGGESYEDHQLVRVFEIWDRASDRLYTLTMDGPERFLIEPREWPYDLDSHFPIVHLKFFPVADRLLPLNPVEVFYDLMGYYNKIMVNYLEKSSRSVPSIVADKTLFSEEDRAAINDGEIMRIIWANGMTSGKMDAMPIPNFPSDERFILTELWNIFNLLAGIDETRAGVSQGADVTATQKLLENQGQQNRQGLLTATFDKFWGDVLRNCLFLIQQFWGPERQFPIYDARSQDIVDWTQWSDEQRNAQYGIVRVVPGTAAPPSRAARQAAASRVLAEITQFLPALLNAEAAARQAGIDFSAAGAAREFLKEFDDVDMDAMFPSLGLTQNPEAENQAMLFGDAPQVSPADADPFHIASHMRFRQGVVTGAFDQQLIQIHGSNIEQARQAITQTAMLHIQEHQAKAQMADPNSRVGQGMQLQASDAAGGGGSPLDAAGQAAAPIQTQGVPSPGDANRIANTGQSVQSAAASLGKIGGQRGGAQNLLSSNIVGL